MSPSPDSGQGLLPRSPLRAWLQTLGRSTDPDQDGVLRIHPRKIYILPTRFGLLYSTMLMAMLLGSNNYGSNPGFLLTFLLAGLGMAALFQTWKNLIGLELLVQNAEPVFCHRDAQFSCRISNPATTPRSGIRLGFHKTKTNAVDLIDLNAGQQLTTAVALPTSRRGLLQPPRLIIESRFPLELFRAWAYLRPTWTALVYPAPADQPDGMIMAGTDSQTSLRQDNGDEDFAGHRPYQTGDNIMHIDWKALARGKGTLTKRFEAESGNEVWLRWDALQATEFELGISKLTRAVIELDQANSQYGMVLPNQRITPGRGPAHRHHCLSALALLGSSSSDNQTGQPSICS